jgi:hypothetical protein
MALAGYDVTPAEEIPHDADGVVAPPPAKTGGRGAIMPIGKSKGKPIADLSVEDLQGALKWCKETDADKFRDLIANLSSELAKRTMVAT